MKKFLCLLLSALMLLAAFPVAAAEGESGGAILANSVADGEYGLRTETIRRNYSIAREASGEGMVLLENNGALPFDGGEKVTLFGVGQYNFVEGGTGSGASFTAYKPDLVDSMKAAAEQGRIELNTAFLDMYYTYWAEKLAEAAPDPYHAANQQAVNMEDVALTEADVAAARAVSDTVIYTISRIQGEGTDRKAIKGDYYISDIEAANLKLINDAGFEKFILILNTSVSIDTSFFKDYDDLDAVLMAWLPGTEGAYAITDILLGDVNPSGKLVDTFASSYDDYPSADFYRVSSIQNYSEDIFNGYRYFETFDPEYTKVNYEFGYGLSYTTFEISNDRVTNDGTTITVEATVKNTGSVAGKEVVQVYFSAPQGKLGKAARELCAYAKTDLLAPGASQMLTMEFLINDMAAFDDLGKTGHKSAYVLEAGDYNIYVGNSVKNAGARGVKGTYNVPELIVTEQLTSLAAPKHLEKRLLADGTWESLQNVGVDDGGSFQIDTTKTKVVIEAENAQRYDEGIETVTLFGGELDNLKYLTGLTTGKSIEYDVTPDKATPVMLTLAVSNPGEAVTAPFKVYLNGTEVTVSAVVKNTCAEGEHVYTEFGYAVLNLADGKNTIKLVSTTDTALELDYLELRPMGNNILGSAARVRVEAEAYNNISDGYNGNLEDASNGSKNLSSFNYGKWTEYLLSVPMEGEYRLILSYAANGNFTSPYTFSANGELIKVSSYSLPDTKPAGASTVTEIYNTVAESQAITLTLPAGIVTFRVTAPGDAPNLDALIFESSFTELSETKDTKIEAEDYFTCHSEYNVNKINLEDASNGSKNLSALKGGKWVEYKLSVPKAGEYHLVFSYAANGDFTDPYTFSANGEAIEVGTYTLKNTKPDGVTGVLAYNTVAESQTFRLTLPEGIVTFRITGVTDNTPNLDALIFKTDCVEINESGDTKIEAENYYNIKDNYTGNFETNSNGSMNLTSFGGKWTEYKLSVPKAGKYSMVLSYSATNTYTSPYKFSANGKELEVDAYTLAKTSPEGSEGNAYWNTVGESDPITVTLPAGVVIFRVTGESDAPNFDAFIFKGYEGGDDSGDDSEIVDNDLSYAETETPLSLIDVYNGKITLDEFIASMTNLDLIKLAGGSAGTVSRSAASFGRLVEYEIPQVTVADGGSGLRLEPDIGATCLPNATLLACTWNTELIREVGRIAGRDGMATNNDGWLSPGMNIHRNPLCGRNFEYFSEDPLVTGISASMVILGAKDEGVSAVPKHFALNNTEISRGISDSRVSERAMREIYLEGFRIMVKLTDTKYLMSSYNKVNGVEVAESYDLLTGILRNEWGFDGVVMTDWANDSNHLKEVLAGNNLKMPKGDINAFVDALADGTIKRSDLKHNAKSLLTAILSTNSMKNAANFNEVSAEKSAVIHAKNFNFMNDNHTGQDADGNWVQAQSWAFIVTTANKLDVYAPLAAEVGGSADYPDRRIFADYYIDALDAGKYTLDLLAYYNSGNGIVDVELDGEPLASVKVKSTKSDMVHTETLVMDLTRGKHKIRLSRNSASTSSSIKLNRVIVSPYLGGELDGNANISGKLIVVGAPSYETSYACDCSASIVLSENGDTKAIVREYDAALVGTDNGNTILSYSFSAPDGTYKISVQKRGYTTVESEIKVSGGFAMIPTLTLKRSDCTVYLPKCEECGRSAQAYDSHSFAYNYDKDHHYLECERCSVTEGEKAAHDFDENGKCKVCAYDSSISYKVKVNVGEFGKVEYNGTVYTEDFTANVQVNKNITLTAIVNGNSPFLGWYAAGTKLSDNTVLEFTVCDNITLDASFFPSYVLFTPESGLSGTNGESAIIATKVEAKDGVPAHINYNVPAAVTANDGSRFYMLLDTNKYPEGYSSSDFPYMKLCYRTKEYTNSLDINIENTQGARAWGGENFTMVNDGNFNTLIYDLAKKSDGTANWSGGNESLNTTSPIFANNFTESPLAQFQIRTAGRQNTTLVPGDLDIAYIAFFSDLEEAKNFVYESKNRRLTLTACGGGSATVGETNIASGSSETFDELKGTELTLTAVPAVGYQIDGWYNVTNGQNILLSRELTYTYTFKSDTELEVRFYDEAVSILQKLVVIHDAKNVGYVTANGLEVDEGGNSYYSSRKTVELKAFANDETKHYPAYWHRLSDHVAFMGVGDTLEAYPLGNSVSYQPVYGTIDDNGVKQPIYLYIDFANAIIDESTSETDKPELPKRAGYTVGEWKLTTLGDDYVKVFMPEYTKSEFTGSSLTVNGKTVDTVYNSMVMLTAEGENFKCFMISIDEGEAEVLSYNREYEYYNIIKGNVAIIESEDYPSGVSAPVSFVKNIQATSSDDKLNFVAAHEVAEGYTLLERGVLMSKTELAKNEFTIDNDSVIKGKIGNPTDEATGIYMVSKGSLKSESTWYGRAYMIVEDNITKTVTVIYADDIISGTYTPEA